MKIMKSDLKFYEKAMSAVADPYRMSILQELSKKGEIRCCDVVDLTGLSQPTCSHHIKLPLIKKILKSWGSILRSLGSEEKLQGE